MEQESFFTKFLKSFTVKEQHQSNRLKVFLACLFISFLIWLFMSLSQRTSATVDFSLIIKNPPAGYVNHSDNPTLIKARIENFGFSLFRLKNFNQPRLVINLDLEEYKQKSGDFREYHFSGSYLRDKIESIISNEAKLIEIYESNLSLRYDQLSTKLVSLALDSSNIPSNITLLSFEVKPDSLEITGPLHIIDSIVTFTIPAEHINFSKEIQSVKLEKINQVQLSAQEVAIKLSKEELHYHEMDIPLVCINIPKNFEVKLFPETVKVSFFHRNKKIEQPTIPLYLDVTESKNNSRLTIKTDSVETAYKNLKVNPEKVDYIIKAK
jgi:hypothetical protein